MSEDPVKDGVNWFVYTANNPLKYVIQLVKRMILLMFSLHHGVMPILLKILLTNLGWALLDTASLLPALPSSGYLRRGVQLGGKVDNAIHLGVSLADNIVKGTGTLAFKTGKEGEEYLFKMLGGKTQKYSITPQGGRYIDVFADGIAHESKVGYASLTSFVKKQIQKDVYARDVLGEVGEVVWHFFKSGNTGKQGPSAPLRKYLIENGIRIIEH